MTIPLPADLCLQPPPAGLAAPLAAFAGCWLGRWGAALPHLLAVERIDADGSVQAVYGLGDAPDGHIRRQWLRLRGRIGSDGLLVFRSSAVSIRYRMDASGRLEGSYQRGQVSDHGWLQPVAADRLPDLLAALPPYRPLAGETLLIPSRVRDAGLGRPANLAATLFRPPPVATAGDAAVPVPLVVFSHGSTGPGAVPPRQMLRYELQARYFLARGFAFLAPMRRGRGASEGEYVEGYDRDPLKLAEGLQHALDDLDAVVTFMRAQPGIDGRRIVVAGQSRGGLLGVAYAGRRPPGVVGSISFAGGWIGDPGGIPLETVGGSDFNRDVFVQAGSSGQAVPSLWLYAANDSYYSPAAIRRWQDGYAAGGGAAQLYLFPPLAEADGHRLLDYPDLWESAADAFLHQIGFSW
ncbi:alpha/beta hydrolase [Ferrovibrio sp.]|uniref:alpha/beta hydrolase n=1 Tax=Ferrovibrio sp. TaxID=1917215 RepID=UPI0035177497